VRLLIERAAIVLLFGVVTPVSAQVPAGIGLPPQSQIVRPGTDVGLIVVAFPPVPVLNYQWYFGGAALPGATAPTLLLPNIQSTNAGTYHVRVDNGSGPPVTSPDASITVVQLQSVSASLGGTAMLQELAQGPGPTSFQWLLKGTAIAGATNAMLVISNAQASDVGEYSVVVTVPPVSFTDFAPALVIDPTFTKVSTEPPVTDSGNTWGASWGAYDGDGYPDLFVARNGAGLSTLYHNNGDGTFTTITNAPFAQQPDAWITGAWADLDNDGRLDLVAARQNEPAIVYFNHADGTFNPVLIEEAAPNNLAVIDYNQDGFLDLILAGSMNWGAPAPSWFYRNNGNRTVSRVEADEVGSVADFAVGGAVSCADYDDDGSMDLFCANWAGPSSLSHNDGAGRFLAVTNVAFQGQVSSGAWGDYDNDGLVDLCAVSSGGATFAGTPGTTVVYRNLGDGYFEPAAVGQNFQGLYSSASWADYDNDGFLDLFLTSFESGKNTLFHNNGDGTFTSVATGSIVNDTGVGSLAGLWFDYDSDGFLDLYVLNNNSSRDATAANFLYHNNSNSNAWLKVKLIGTLSNRNGVGAKVRVQARYAGQTRWQRRDITGGDALGGNQLYAHFGLGDATNVDTVRIEWPSGIVQVLTNVAPKQVLTVTEQGAGILPLQQPLVVSSNLTFRASSTLASPLRYQWRFNGADLPGQTNAVLVVADAQSTNLGQYTVFVSTADGLQSMSSMPALATWSGTAVIESVPAAQVAIAGSDASFSVLTRPSSGNTLKYQWRFNGTALPAATNASLVLTNITLKDAGTYSVIVSNSTGAVINDKASLTVAQMQSSSASLGGTASLQEIVAGLSPTQFEWRLDGVPITGGTNSSLVISNAQPINVGQYSVVVIVATGSVTNFAPALVIDPTFTKITTGPPVTDRGSTWGCSWGDYDGDGYPDLFVARHLGGLSAIYHNNGDGTFTTITNTPFAQQPDAWITGAWADLDNDGRADLVTARLGESAIVYFNNVDGTFSPVQVPERMPNNVAPIDYNQDGQLDLVLGGSIEWPAPGRSLFYRNNGDRTFTGVGTNDVGAIANFVMAGSATCVDYDDDGSVDVFCANWAGSSALYHNDGTGRFEPVTNLVFQSHVVLGAWGDYDNDGRLDLCAVSAGDSFVLDPGTTFVYKNLGGGKFEQAAIGQSVHGQYFTASWADYDNDGFLDLFLTSVVSGKNTLYHNNGDGTFTRITTGSYLTDVSTGIYGSAGSWAALWFDYDNDGFLDLYVLSNNIEGTADATNFLYHNNGNSNAWLKVKLIGTVSNRDAVGAKVRVQATYAGQERWQRRDITGGDVYGGNQLYAHFGLGDATNVDTVRIEWPSGIVQVLTNVEPKQLLTVVEPTKLKTLGATEFQIQSWKGMQFQIGTSTNCVDWAPLMTVTNTTGTLYFKDPTPPTGDRRFYRAVSK
jgi:hypothetical protein